MTSSQSSTLLGCANGLLGRLIQSFQFSDWEGALAGADINVIILLACFAGISLVSTKTPEHVQPLDLVVALVFLILVALPIFPLSWVGVTVLSLYILLFANNNRERVRGALILLAMTAPMLWSRLLFQIFAKPILDIDASLVSLLLGTPQDGQHGRLPGRIRLHDRTASLLLAGEHVAGAVVLGYHHAMGWTPVDCQGRVLGRPRLRVCHRCQRDAHQPDGI